MMTRNETENDGWTEYKKEKFKKKKNQLINRPREINWAAYGKLRRRSWQPAVATVVVDRGQQPFP